MARYTGYCLRCGGWIWTAAAESRLWPEWARDPEFPCRVAVEDLRCCDGPPCQCPPVVKEAPDAT